MHLENMVYEVKNIQNYSLKYNYITINNQGIYLIMMVNLNNIEELRQEKLNQIYKSIDNPQIKYDIKEPRIFKKPIESLHEGLLTKEITSKTEVIN